MALISVMVTKLVTMNTYINATEKLKTTVADKMQSIFSTGYSSITTSPLYTK